jgi:hypothetical protein
MRGMVWHPYAETYPLLEGDEFDRMVASIRRTRGNAEKPCYYRMVKGEPQGLDGRNREKACKLAKVKCTWKKVVVADEDVEEFIDRHNDVRRHMTAEQRRERVAKLRAQGRSTYEIAEKVGASQATVRRDLEQTGDTAPSEIVGQDGRKQKAHREDDGDAAEGPVLCSRCKRIGKETPVGCENCAEARKKDAKRAAKKGKAAGPQKNGQVAYDDRPLRDAKGVVTREIDKLARMYGMSGGKEHQALHEAHKTFQAAFAEFWRTCRSQKRPAAVPA